MTHHLWDGPMSQKCHDFARAACQLERALGHRGGGGCGQRVRLLGTRTSFFTSKAHTSKILMAHEPYFGLLPQPSLSGVAAWPISSWLAC